MTLLAPPGADTGVTAGAAHGAAAGAAAGRGRRWPGWSPSPWHVLLAVVLSVAALVAAGPLSDVDVYWHVLVGRDIAVHHRLMTAGSGWSIAPGQHHWVSSQWLAETVMYAVTAAGGWRALLVLRLLLALVVLGGLCLLVLRNRRTPWPALLLAPLAWATMPALEERPQLASMLLLLWLAPRLARATQGPDRSLPSPLAVLGVTVLWANLHGYWILVPACLALLAAGRAVDTVASRRADRPRPEVARPALLAALATAAGMLTPQGPAGLLNPVRFAAATEHIAEWQPPTLHDPLAVVLLTVVVAVVVCWARSATPVALDEVVVVLGLLGFAALALRDIPPAALLLAPIAATVVDRSTPAERRPRSARERRWLAGAVVGVALLGATAAAVRVAVVDPVPPTEPKAAAAWLARTPGEHRVLDGYNVSGYLLWAGGERVRVAVDGRADYYGGAYVDRYMDLVATNGDWQPLLRRLRPTEAVLNPDAPLVRELRERHWRVVLHDAGYVLLTSRR